MASASSQSTGFVARMLHGHSAVGLAVGALMYILCLSGTLMVFHEELERWEQPGVPEFHEVTLEAASKAGKAGLTRLEEESHHFFLGIPTADMPRMTVSFDGGVGWFADQSGNLVDEIHHPFTDFLQEMHYYLHLPQVLGLTVVGILGVMLTKLVISGLLAHPRLFRDAFSMRFGKSRQLAEADLHNRLSVWGAPFHILVALTGAFVGLASVLSYFAAGTYLSSDIEKFYEPIFGAHPVEDETEAPVSDFGTALAQLKAGHPDVEPWYVIIDDPGTKGQAGFVLAKHTNRLIYGENYYFDDAGNLTGTIGHSSGPAAQQVVASAYTVHFGSFGGLPIKLIYGILGLALCVISASGINIWLLKRRAKGMPSPKLEKAWAGTVWGTPLAMVLCYLLGLLLGVEKLAMNLSFWVVALLCTFAGLMASNATQWARTLRFATGALLLFSLSTHMLVYGHQELSPAAWGVNGAILLAATALIWMAMTRRSAPVLAAEPAN